MWLWGKYSPSLLAVGIFASLIVLSAYWGLYVDIGMPMAFKAGPAVVNPLTADFVELQSLLSKKKLKSADLVDLYWGQIRKHDGYLKAMINFKPIAIVKDAANALDRERSTGNVRGPLHGIPIIIKDNINTHPELGFQTTAGSYALENARPRQNAKIVDKLIAAGAIIIGKANLSELANYKGTNITSGWSALGGQTQSAYVRGDVNPDDGKDGHSNPSGSSSGPAVAVSAGFSPFSIGTETDGSLVIPASRAALYTIKPTIGLISQDGIVPISHHFDSAGPMAKTPFDLAILLDAIVEPEQRPQDSYTTALTDSWSDIGVATLDPGVWKFPAEWLHPVESATEQINREIRAAYAKIESLARNYAGNVPLIDPDAFKLNGTGSEGMITDADFVVNINSYLQSLEHSEIRSLEALIEFNKEHAGKELPPYAPNQNHLIRAFNLKITSEQYDEHLKHLRDISRTRGIDFIVEKYKVDVILAPADSLLISFATCSGYPISSMPLGYLDYNGRPFGVAAIARAHQEALLVKVMGAWEATFGKRKPPPDDMGHISAKF